MKVFLIGHYYLHVGYKNAHAIYYPVLNGVISLETSTYSLTEYNIQTLSYGTYLLYSTILLFRQERLSLDCS